MTSAITVLDVTYRALVMVLGIVGNVAAIVLIPRVPQLRTWENAFHVILCVVDLCTSAVSVPVGIAEALLPGQLIPVITCMQRGLYSFCTLANLVILSDIAVLRCFRVRNETKVIPKQVFIVGVILQVSAPLLVTVPSLFVPDKVSFKLCPHLHEHIALNGTEVSSAQQEQFGALLVVALVTICSVKIVASYVLLLRYIHQVNRQVHIQPPTVNNVSTAQNQSISFVMATFREASRHDTEFQNMESERRAIQYARKICINISIVLLIFVCSFLPMLIVRMLDYFEVAHVSDEMKSLLTAFAYTSSYTNPYFYTLQNGALKSELKKLKDRLGIKCNL